MSRTFGLQISPDLIIKLTQQDQQPQASLSKPPRKPSKPKPSPKQPPDTFTADQKTPPWQPPSPALLPPGFLPGFAHDTPKRDPHDGELEPFRKVLSETEKVVETLRKQEGIDREEVQRRARELHEKQYRVHDPRSVPCQDAEQACIRCYQQNPGSPLKCAESVRAYVECSRQVRQRFVAAGFEQPV